VRAAAAAAAVLVLAGCGGGNGERPLADRLDELGFFRYTPPARRAEFREAIRKEGASAAFVVETRRLFPVPADALAEGGVAEAIARLRPVFARLHVRVPPVRQSYRPGGPYRVRVGDRSWTIYTRAEEEDAWPLSLARTIELLDALLERSGSDERFYALGSGDDSWLFLLTPAMQAAIAGALPEDDPQRPYAPRA
jgi:hypothetical protein